VQLWQTAPAKPQAVVWLASSMHAPLWQQPWGQVVALHVPPSFDGAWHAPLTQLPPFGQFWP